MAEIIPAILEKNFSEIKNKLTALREQARFVHIDICDGVSVPSQSWPFSSGGSDDYDFRKIINEEEGMPFWEEFDFEFDLMVADAVENFDLYIKLGPKRIIFHPDLGGSTEEFENFLEGLDMYIRDNVQIGMAFKPSDDLAIVSKLSNKADFLHCMGSDKIGFQGEAFSEKALENILKAYEKDSTVNKHIRYWMGRAYHLNYKFDEALLSYNIYKNTLRKKDQRSEDLRLHLEQSAEAKKQSESPQNYLVQNMGNHVNSTFSDHSPVISNDGQTIYFTSRRET
ncbi:MAG: hypothetical protein V4699_02800, partial [Patescibacteria group bacterium]